MKQLKAYILPILIALGFIPFSAASIDLSTESTVVFESEIEESFEEESEPSLAHESNSIFKAKDGGNALISRSFSLKERISLPVVFSRFRVERTAPRTLPLFILYCCLKVDC